MPIWLSELCEGVHAQWIEATPWDYARATLLIVVLGWVLTRRWTN